jgi:peroxiredoxin Q/BCP
MQNISLWIVSALAALAQGPSGLNRVAAGSPAPAFDLPSLGGGRVSLESLKGSNTVLVFYRGYWWPYCVTQLVELQTLLSAELAKTTRIVAIAPDPPEKLGDIVDKVKAKAQGKFSVTLLSNADHAVIDRYGLLNEQAARRGRFLPHPTTYVIDKQGIVRWKFT